MRKQETRTRKKAKRVRKSRRQKQKRSHTKRQRHRRSSHRHKQQGGNYAKDFTGESIDGMPYAKDAVVVAGQDVMDATKLQQHADYLDSQGKEQ
jgi:hypothetical protein